MKKQIFILLILLFVSWHFLAINSITLNHNGFRPGDKIKKQQLEYKNAGRKGANVVWDFSKLKAIDENYSLRYNAPLSEKDDTICIYAVEHQTRYNYELIHDSLFVMSFVNVGSRMSYKTPQLCLKFPFNYCDSINSSFYGVGDFQGLLKVENNGVSYSVADAYGTLILPNNDTIKNSIRVKTCQTVVQETYPFDYSPEKLMMMDSLSRIQMDSIRKSETDTINLRIESYKWYAPGYRYPLFETMINRSHSVKDTTEIPDIATSFYYPPFERSNIVNDEINKAILDSIQNGLNNVIETVDDTLHFEYNYYPNPVRSFLTFELLLDFQSTVSFRIYDLSGQLKFYENKGLLSNGLHYFSFALSNLNLGEYVLHIIVNDQVAQATIMKF